VEVGFNGLQLTVHGPQPIKLNVKFSFLLLLVSLWLLNIQTQPSGNFWTFLISDVQFDESCYFQDRRNVPQVFGKGCPGFPSFSRNFP
jgi:hypothetical protein